MPVHASIEPLAWESEFFQRHSAKLIFSDSAPQLNPAELGAFTLTQAKVPTHRLDLIDPGIQLGMFRKGHFISLRLTDITICLVVAIM